MRNPNMNFCSAHCKEKWKQKEMSREEESPGRKTTIYD